MQKIIAMIFLCSVLCFNSNLFTYSTYAIDKDNIKDTNYFDRYTEQVNICLKDVEVKQEDIDISYDYDKFAILTFTVVNTSLKPLELSDIDYKFYQNNKLQETFTNKEDNIYGFLGSLESGESKTIKICVSLENIKQPIVFLINNKCGNYKYNIKQIINIV